MQGIVAVMSEHDQQSSDGEAPSGPESDAVGQSSLRRVLREHTNPPVFIVSAIAAVAFVLWGVIAPASVSNVAGSINDFITTNFSWLYIFAATGFVIFVLVVMFSRYGHIRLGPSNSSPEYGTMSWFAMMFTAAMGIGLVFFAVSEPITHFQDPPTGEGGTKHAAQNAMTYLFYHWGLHPWAIYVLLGMTLGYFAFRKGLPLRPAAAFYPLIGDRIYRWPGAVVDVLAVFGTLFGLGTSLGIGGQQVGAGLETLFGVTNGPTLQVILILAITAIAVVSVMLGIDKGIRNLSLANLWLAFILMVFVFAFGPTRNLLSDLAGNVGHYLEALPGLSFETFTGGRGKEWQDDWTLFYWGWWMSWSPFVGMFLARISYGRTIRSFVVGALFAPVGASMVWLTVFGDTGLRTLLSDPGNALAKASDETALFVVLDQLPVAGFVSIAASVIGIIVVVLFFATSSDSGSLVVDILTNGGDPNPRWQQRLFWAVLEGVIAAVLLAAGAASGEDALGALQAASIVVGLPLCLVLIAMCFSLVKAFNSERFIVSAPHAAVSPAAGMRAAARRHASDGAAAEQPPDMGTAEPTRSETAIAELSTTVTTDDEESDERAGTGV